MPWSDDTRCLFCDGKLPLYRKLTQGQFCSKQHQKAYWEEQERLAVERLHQTHNELYAYRAAEPIESILGPELVPALVEPPTAGSRGEESPAFGAIIPDSLAARVATVPDFVAADPLEYEMAVRPFAPQPGSRVIESRTVRALRSAGPARLSFALTGHPLPPQVRTSANAHVGADIAPVAAFALTATPRHDLGLADRLSFPLTGRSLPLQVRASENAHVDMAIAPVAVLAWTATQRHDLALAGQRRLPFIGLMARAAAPVFEARHLAIEIEAVREVALRLEPRHEVLEHLLLEQLPVLHKLFALGYSIGMAGTAYLPTRRIAVKRFAIKRVPDLPASTGLQGIFGEYAPVSAGLRALGSVLGLRLGAVAAPAPRPQQAQQAQPCDVRPLAPLSVSLNAPPAVMAYEPGTPGLVQLSAAMQAPVAPALPESAGQLETRVPPYTLPAYLRRPEPVRSVVQRATKVVRLPYRADREQPRQATIKPRSAGPMLALNLAGDPLLPEHRAEPMRDKPYSDAMAAAARASMPWVKLQSMVGHGVDFWRNAPRDLKLLAFAIPALLALVFAPSLPKISVGMPQLSASFPIQIRQVFNDQVEGIRQSMANRAGIALNEDFRAGLDEWISKGGATTQWSFDATGFVRPGPLALYAPSMNLTDYQMQFMGILDKESLNWVVRAKDFQNYYVVKLVVAKPGPVPTLRLTRYAVINGKATGRVDTRVPLVDARNDTNYRIRMDVSGDNFSVMIQEQMIDSWTETRLERGGVGFYTSGNERSRIRWVQVTHQYDMLGRLCAYLAPVNFPTTTGSW